MRGLEETGCGIPQPALLGTALYAAPEYFLAEPGCEQSDLYSLAVLAYYLLSGDYPYGTSVARSRSTAAQKRLAYRPLFREDREVPRWIDATLKKALHPEPGRRYETLSEFLRDVEQPSAQYLASARAPLIDRNPIMFWQCVSLLLLLVVIYQAAG